MTQEVKLVKSGVNGCTIDLTSGHNVSVSQTISNPLIVIATPATEATPSKPNQIAINIGLLQIRYTVSFDLIDGIATNLWGSPSGNTHDKLRSLFSAGASPTFNFTWGTATTPVQMESFNISSKPGKIDATGQGLTSGTIVLVESQIL